MNGFWMLAVLGMTAATVVLALVVDLGDRQAEADAAEIQRQAEFRRRLNQIPDLECSGTGHHILNPPLSTGGLPGKARVGGVVSGVRAIRPRTIRNGSGVGGLDGFPLTGRGDDTP